MSAVRRYKLRGTIGGRRKRGRLGDPKVGRGFLGKVRKTINTRKRRRRTGPQLSPNPGRTARFYRSNRRSRLKRRRDQQRINNTPQKRRYRRDLMRIRRKRRPGPQTDMSHRGGRIVRESRRRNRGRGGARRA